MTNECIYQCSICLNAFYLLRIICANLIIFQDEHTFNCRNIYIMATVVHFTDTFCTINVIKESLFCDKYLCLQLSLLNSEDLESNECLILTYVLFPISTCPNEL